MVDISVVICAFSERRWRDLEAAIGSVNTRHAKPARSSP